MAVRPRIQRCFVAWLEEARPRLAAQPRILRRDDLRLRMSFAGLTPVIGATLSRYDIDVCVEWREVLWDFVYSEYVAVRGRRGAYVCAACAPEARAFYPSREALWQGHLFEPFLKWVNGTLAPASRVVLYAGDGWQQDEPGWSAARLWREGDNPRFLEGAVAVLPLRSGPAHVEPGR
ncbi:hypothetical protein ACFQS7_29340 [Dankookia sp. GCM10030260]|uniref:hypothetical protein n=1 Tax=Dankookia sp. GCM10030260 TaxID=3273390 RepID=UPI0036223121